MRKTEELSPIDRSYPNLSHNSNLRICDRSKPISGAIRHSGLRLRPEQTR